MTANSDTSPTIGRYQLIAEIGRGGMSTVYLAILRGMAGFDKLLVVKVLRDTTSQPQEMAQFVSEAQLAARLNHPNVVQSHEVGEDDGRYFIAMEYLEGLPLSRLGRPSSQQTLPLELHLRVLCDVLSALHYAHELSDYDGQSLGIVHRDVSPQNVFVTYDGVVKLLDFGIAKSKVVASEQTRTGIIKGKIGYLAPEQLSSGKTTQRVDIFAVGLMMWEAITGRRIWDGLSEYDILLQLARREIPPVRTLCPDLPEPLLEICERALKPEPEERFATAHEFRAALEDYLGSFTSRASSAALAKYMTDRFGDERKKMRAVVKQRLAALQTADPTSDAIIALPTLSAIRGEPTLTGSRRFTRQTTSTSARYALAAEALARDLPAPHSPSKRTWLIGSSAVVVALVAGVASRHPPAVDATAVAAVAPVAAVTPVVAAAIPTQPPIQAPNHEAVAPSEVRFSASPPEARLYLDNALLPSNPYVGKFAKNSIAHQLRVDATGFQSRTELVDFDSDRTISIELARIPVVAGFVRRPTPTHAAPATPSVRGRVGDSASVGEGAASSPAPAAAPPRPAAASTRELDDSMPFHAPKRIDESNPFK